MGKYSIAIDGPSGAGKSTIAKNIAKKLDYIYLDTGAMYRAVGLYYTNLGISLEDEEEINALLDDITITINYIDGCQQILLNQKDVTNLIRSEEASRGASKVSVYPKVREKMVKLQQEIASQNNVVMDGRDIGSVVLPNATLKIFLTASVEERAERRYKEQLQKGYQVTLEDIIKDIKERDYRDTNRKVNPLKQVSDAILIDSSKMSIQEVEDKILKLLEEKLSR